MKELWKRKEKKIKDRERSKKYNCINVIGGLGSWRITPGSKTNYFMVSFPRPLPPGLVHKKVLKLFNGSNEIVHISTPITPESVSYAFKVKYPMKVSHVWNKCVEVFSECFNL